MNEVEAKGGTHWCCSVTSRVDEATATQAVRNKPTSEACGTTDPSARDVVAARTLGVAAPLADSGDPTTTATPSAPARRPAKLRLLDAPGSSGAPSCNPPTIGRHRTLVRREPGASRASTGVPAAALGDRICVQVRSHLRGRTAPLEQVTRHEHGLCRRHRPPFSSYRCRRTLGQPGGLLVQELAGRVHNHQYTGPLRCHSKGCDHRPPAVPPS